ncbi:MAG: TetR/AcrR family transcriptional regulator [Alphaproteobacteria bacterium]|nr:TetR/AcrR family transcriptional regulator [Alphaproteobacteria bacterium]
MARKSGSYSEITGPKVKGAALKLFAEYGYAAVSMRQIAREVQVQVGTLYLYTSNKQNLLFDLLQDHMTQLLAALKKSQQPKPPTEQLREFCRFHIFYHLDRADAVFISYMELRNLNDENFRLIENLRREYENQLEVILSAGQSEGVFAVEDTKITTLALIAMLTGVTTWYRQDGRLSRDHIEQVYWEMIKKLVGV